MAGSSAAAAVEPRPARERHAEESPRRERAIVFALAAAVVALYAVRGGTYDVVARGEAGVVAWWVLGIGVAVGVLPRAVPRRAAAVAAGALLGLVLLTILSFSWTQSDERTSVELARTVHHLGLLALVAAGVRGRTASAAVAGATAAAVGVCLLALAQRLLPGTFPEDPVESTFALGRLNFPLDYWNGLAAWGAMATAMALAWSVHARAVAWRAIALAAVPVCVLVVYLTYSRAGAIGLVLGTVVVLAVGRTHLLALLHAVVAGALSLLVVAVAHGRPELATGAGTSGRGAVVLALLGAMVLAAAAAAALARLRAGEVLTVPRRHARPALVAGAAVALAAAVLVAPGALSRAWDDFSRPAPPVPATADPSARLTTLSGTRYVVWRAAIDAWESAPNTGTGPGTFEFWWNRHATNTEFIRDAHNVYLEALAELGWPGLLAVLALVGGAVAGVAGARRRAVRSREAGAATAAAAVVVLWCFHAGVDWMWEQTAVTALMLVVAGACTAGAHRRREPLRPAVRAGVPVAAALAILVQLPPATGTSAVRDSQAAVGRGDLAAAGAHAQDAVDAWPWAATPLVQRALVGEAAGDRRAAIADVRRAARREPRNWRHPFLLARLEAEAGRPRAALAAFRRAKALRPLAPVFPPPGS